VKAQRGRPTLEAATPRQNHTTRGRRRRTSTSSSVGVRPYYVGRPPRGALTDTHDTRIPTATVGIHTETSGEARHTRVDETTRRQRFSRDSFIYTPQSRNVPTGEAASSCRPARRGPTTDHHTHTDVRGRSECVIARGGGLYLPTYALHTSRRRGHIRRGDLETPI
jgi:hypothetical protein